MRAHLGCSILELFQASLVTVAPQAWKKVLSWHIDVCSPPHNPHLSVALDHRAIPHQHAIDLLHLHAMDEAQLTEAKHPALRVPIESRLIQAAMELHQQIIEELVGIDGEPRVPGSGPTACRRVPAPPQNAHHHESLPPPLLTPSNRRHVGGSGESTGGCGERRTDWEK